MKRYILTVITESKVVIEAENHDDLLNKCEVIEFKTGATNSRAVNINCGDCVYEQTPVCKECSPEFIKFKLLQFPEDSFEYKEWKKQVRNLSKQYE